jgi:hypothetical protein
MSQQIPPPPKKVVSRGVAIGLGIICLILIVGLIGAIADYTSIISGKDSTINSLNSQVSSLKSIVGLSNSTTWVSEQTVSQGAGSYSTWTFSASYSGYVSVYVEISNVSDTNVEVIYFAYGVSFHQTQVVSEGNNIAFFPILPCSDITVGVGNGSILSGATETVTITYYY